MNSIQPSENHEIVAGGGAGLCSFFCPGDIDTAFRENKWAINDMVEVLVGIVQNKVTRTITRRDGSVIKEPIVTVRERMAALAMLDKKAREGMTLGGLILKDRLTVRKKLEDGSEAEYNAEGMRLTQEGSSRLKSTLALLEGASRSKSDEVIEVQNERNDDGSDESGGRGPSLPRQPGGSNYSVGPVRTSGGDGSLGPGGGRDVVCGTVHGQQWTGSGDAQHFGSGAGTGLQQNDESTVKGAEDERGGRVPEQSERGPESEGTGGEGVKHRDGDRPDPVAPKRPVVPGESGVKCTNWWEPGVPRRSPDSDPGSARDCVTAESSVDRLKRIERAREQAAAASASYLERRAKNQRSSNLAPGDEPRTCD